MIVRGLDLHGEPRQHVLARDDGPFPVVARDLGRIREALRRQLHVGRGHAFAQGAALMKGRANPDDPARAYPGDRPSSTLLLDRLDARTLGALIAFYEHRVFANGVLLGINSFDQFGVELGKEMAKAAAKGGGDFDPSTDDLIARAFGSDDEA